MNGNQKTFTVIYSSGYKSTVKNYRGILIDFFIEFTVFFTLNHPP